MEMHPILLRYSPWPLFFFHLQRSPFPPPNYVHRTETPTSHLYAANLPGLRKEEIRVEVEDSLYMVIRTELCNTGIGTEELQEEEKEERMRQRCFNRKFRLPVRVDLEGITARYEDGVLTVTVPRLIRRRQIEYSGLDQEVKSVARAA